MVFLLIYQSNFQTLLIQNKTIWRRFANCFICIFIKTIKMETILQFAKRLHVVLNQRSLIVWPINQQKTQIFTFTYFSYNRTQKLPVFWVLIPKLFEFFWENRTPNPNLFIKFQIPGPNNCICDVVIYLLNGNCIYVLKFTFLNEKKNLLSS